MEKEIKFIFKNTDSFKKLKDDILKNTGIQTVEMRAVYYDTPNDKLRESGTAIRTRKENEKMYLTVKSMGSAKKGVHERKEWNVLLKNGELNFDLINKKDIESSDSIEEFMQIIETLKTVELKEICRTDFLRTSFEMTDGKNIAEIALDEGSIFSGEKAVPICELEIELIDGENGYIEHLAEEFSSKYSLMSENESKYARGLALYLSK